MTREEAIEVIKDIYNYTKWDTYTTNEARTMAIKALEQEPCDKNINEIDHLRKYISKLETQIVEQEPSVEILKTEESNDNGTKYLNINVSDGEVKRNPDIVRLCSDVGVLEYTKLKTGHWIGIDEEPHEDYECDRCGYINIEPYTKYKYCPNCGARMESEDKE